MIDINIYNNLKLIIDISKKLTKAKNWIVNSLFSDCIIV